MKLSREPYLRKLRGNYFSEKAGKRLWLWWVASIARAGWCLITNTEYYRHLGSIAKSGKVTSSDDNTVDFLQLVPYLTGRCLSNLRGLLVC